MGFDYGTGTPRELPPPQTQDDDDDNLRTMVDMMNVKRPRWLIPDFLMEQQNGGVYGLPGCKKSFALLGISQMLAHGMDWQGRPLTPRKVIYVCGEGYPMFYQRRLAWFRYHNIDPFAGDKNFLVHDGAFLITKSEEVVRFIRRVERRFDDVGLIIFDTLSTFNPGLDENGAEMMTGAIEGIKTVGRALKCATIAVHHPGKNVSNGPRGHSSFVGNLDMVAAMHDNEAAGTCSLFIEKQKDAEHGPPIFFGKHVVKLGFPEDDDYPEGKEASSLCLVPQKPPVAAAVAAQTTNRVDADRNSITWAMEVGKPMSRTKLAKKIHATLQCSVTTAKERIASTLTSEWQRAVRSDGTVFELRSEEAGTGHTKMVEMRLLHKPPQQEFLGDE